MIDLLTVLPLSIALSGPAHDSLASGPQPRDLEWTHAAAFKPVNGDTYITEKWDTEAGTVAVRTHLRPGRGITNSAYVLSGVAGYRVARSPRFPLDPLCCRQGSPVTADPPATDPPAPVSLPASVWLVLAGIGAFIPFARPSRLRRRLRSSCAY